MRRVMLERAAWQLRHGATVTDAAFAADYESVESVSRAFARASGHRAAACWTPPPASPTGIGQLRQTFVAGGQDGGVRTQ